MHARARDFPDRPNRPRDLPFERAAVVHLFQELRGAERGAVEDLEADASRRRQAARRELEPELVSSVTGKPAPLDEKNLPRYIVLYRTKVNLETARRLQVSLPDANLWHDAAP